ncbi:cyclase family protein [Virgibacillus sp. DJP39]|uniref:cyclase family protein n=1 Tax=Virgibacillus sp. DJP39 TaxID=3409790 RepID=UPI003BB6421B
MCNFVHQHQQKPSKSHWGPEDEIGRLNLITNETKEKVLQSVDLTKTFDLSLTYFEGMPAWSDSDDPPFQLRMTHAPSGSKETTSYSDDALTMNTHCGTHIDALNHFGYDGSIWNEFHVKEHLGDRHWNKCGPENYPIIVARALMLDVATAKGVDMLPESYGIGKSDLQETMDIQGVTVEKGDIILIRTGRMAEWPDREKYLTNSPGLNLEGAEFLAGLGAMIIGSDNIALEQEPSVEIDNYFPVHTYLLAEVGIPILELVWLEELAKEKIYKVGFVGKAMPIEGATGAPIQPIVFPIK